MYAGVCGSDIPRFGTKGSYYHPIILGHEFMGKVDEPSPASTLFHGGELVAVSPLIPCGRCEACAANEPFQCEKYQFLGSRNDGGFAEYCLVPEINLVPLPPGIDPRAGALIEPIAVALHTVRRSEFRSGQSALVFGAGVIGILTALWLRILGASRVVLSDIRDESLATAGKAGFDELYDPEDEAFSRLRNFDLVFEAAGSLKAFLHAIEKVKPKGSIVVVGRDTADTTIPLKTFESFMRKELNVYGCWGYKLAAETGLILEMIVNGKLPVSSLITHEIPLHKSVEIIRGMIEREFYYCKVLLKI